MKEVLNVLLIEDDTDMCNKIRAYCTTQTDINIRKVTNSSNAAFKFVLKDKPDAIILDLELHQGEGDGISFLSKLDEFCINPKPYIVVTTHNSSSVTYEQARALGADYIFYKHSTNYTYRTPVDFLCTLKNTILKSQTPYESNIEDDSNLYIETLKNDISLELDHVGISHKVLGYTYLLESIIIHLTREDCDKYIHLLAEKYQKKSSSITRAMQTAIERAWKVTCVDDLIENYTARINSVTGVPTVTEFISYYTHKFNSRF